LRLSAALRLETLKGSARRSMRAKDATASTVVKTARGQMRPLRNRAAPATRKGHRR